MYMKRFSPRSALFIRMERNTDTLKKTIADASTMLNKNINTLPKVVRGNTVDRAALLLPLMDTETDGDREGVCLSINELFASRPPVFYTLLVHGSRMESKGKCMGDFDDYEL